MTVTRIDVELTEQKLQESLVSEASRGLLAATKVLPPKYFYDQRGSDLFERITELPEYYPTRLERRILSQHADDILATTPTFTSLVELGSGSSSKTPLLLNAMQRRSRHPSYVPVDVSAHALTGAVKSLRVAYPSLPIHGVVTDFEDHLDSLPNHGGRLFALLGSTIGNLDPEGRAGFLSNVALTLGSGEGLLLGLDLVKDRRRLIQAYDDPSGTTRSFNLNMLNVLNRLLGADFDPDRFDHVALWNEQDSRIEMRLRARQAMKVRLARMDATVAFEEGEEICTEYSTKFRRATVESEFSAAGLEVVGWWTEREKSRDAEYAVVLGVRP